jgi:hypothetical protein
MEPKLKGVAVDLGLVCLVVPWQVAQVAVVKVGMLQQVREPQIQAAAAEVARGVLLRLVDQVLSF